MRKIFLTLIGLACAATAFGNSAHDKVTRSFKLKGFSYDVAEEALRPMLTDSTAIQYDPVEDAVTLYDYPSKLKNAELKYNQFLRDLPNVKVTLTSHTTTKSTNQTLGTGTTSTRGKHTTHNVNKRAVSRNSNGVRFSPAPTIAAMQNSGFGHVSAGVGTTTTNAASTTFITTKSGYPARLWRGTSSVKLAVLEGCVFNEQREMLNRQAVIVTGPKTVPVIENTGVSLLVRPVALSGERIEVTIIPEISYATHNGNHATVHLTTLETTVTLHRGVEMEIAGILSKHKQTFISLFGPTFYNEKSFQQMMSMTLSAETLKSNKKP